MDPAVEAGVEDATTVTAPATSSVEDGLRVDDASVVTLSCDATSVSYTEEQCDVLKGGQVQVQDDGEVLLVQGLQDFQGVVSSETVVVDDGQGQVGLSRNSPYQQYQPVVVQGFVTSSGEVVHVVQQDVPVSSSHGYRTLASQHQQYQPAYQHQQPMMHPDLYRLVKMFPDFSTKTLHRIFVMCHCDLKRALDQALFARQFRQLDSAPAYSPVAPSSTPHFHPSPYRTAARAAPAPAPSYMQPQLDLGADVYLPRGHGHGHGHGHGRAHQVGHQSQQPILLYQQADPRLNKAAAPTNGMVQSLGGSAAASLDTLGDAEVVEIKLDDQGLSDGLCLAGLDGPVVDAGLGPGGDSLHCSKDGLVPTSRSDGKSILANLDDVNMRDSIEVCEVVTSQAAAVC